MDLVKNRLSFNKRKNGNCSVFLFLVKFSVKRKELSDVESIELTSLNKI